MNKERENIFLESLLRGGLSVRDYDPLSIMRLYKAADSLHAELCKLDGANLDTWRGLTVVELLNIFARCEDLREL